MLHDMGSLNDAIATRRFTTAVQEVHGVDDCSQVLYGECLTSLRGRDGTVHSAGAFIPALESAGLLPIPDAPVLQITLDALDRDRSAMMGCNLSVDNFRNATGWNRLLTIIDMAADLASRLVLEITETMDLDCLVSARSMLSDARSLGCRIATDGFGAGYATFARHYAIDPDIVKIDAAILHRSSAAARAHNDDLRRMVELAASVAAIVVVEGVEDIQQLTVAAEAGASQVQGYLLSRPVPVETWLDGRAWRQFSYGCAAE